MAKSAQVAKEITVCHMYRASILAARPLEHLWPRQNLFKGNAMSLLSFCFLVVVVGCHNGSENGRFTKRSGSNPLLTQFVGLVSKASALRPGSRLSCQLTHPGNILPFYTSRRGQNSSLKKHTPTSLSSSISLLLYHRCLRHKDTPQVITIRIWRTLFCKKDPDSYPPGC